MKPLAVPSTSAERMRIHREKVSLIQQNAYAKEAIREMQDPSIEELLNSQQFSGQLDAGNVVQLKNFLKNLKAQRKKEEAATLEKVKEELNIREKAQRIGNLEISELDRILLSATSEQERVELMRKKIKENIFVFCEYMEILKPRSEDFLRHIIEFHDELDERKFTMLFVRVCVMHRGEQLSIKPEMVNQAMGFLIESKTHPTAALGLLKLTYENQIALTEFSMDRLLRFQQSYENQIIHFIKSLSRVKQHVVESLPPTIFLFTKPVLSTLLAGGDVLYSGVPPQFLPYIVSLVCYTFNGDQAVFDEFLLAFKEGCGQLYDGLLQSDFQNLLQSLIDQSKQRVPKFFQDLANCTKVIRSSFQLLTEKQIARFDQLTVRQLVFGSQEVIQMLQQRPKIIASTHQSGLELLAQYVAKANPDIDIDIENLSIPLEEAQLKPFKALGISALLDIQEIAFKILLNQGKNCRVFLRYDTGQGKTALCMAIAVIKVLQGERSIIVNQSRELTFRDFKKALAIMNDLPITISHVENFKDLKIFSQSLVYISADIFHSAQESLAAQDIEKTTIIIDEFDSLLFRESPNHREVIQALLKFPRLIGMTGSDLQIQHQSIITKFIKGQFINIHAKHNERSDIVCRSIEVHGKKADYYSAIINLIERQTNLTPVIIVVEQGFEAIYKQVQSHKIRAENLNSKEAPQIEAILSTFSLKSLGRFGTFIINQEQGRGIDFQSSSEIEKSGGIYLVLGCMPPNFLSLQQILGRTGRIGNQGQYSVILFDKDSKNIDSSQYYKQKLEELKNIDIQRVARLSQSLSGEAIEPSTQIAEIETQLIEQRPHIQIEEEKQEPDLMLFTSSSQPQLMCEETVTEGVNIIQTEGQCDPPQSQPPEHSANSSTLGSKRKQKQASKAENITVRLNRSRDKKIVERDRAYFESYEQPDIHREMTDDQQRMNLFDEAIGRAVCNKRVLDIGAGSGVLCIMAAKAGAQRVVGVEHSQYFKVAEQSVIDNNLQDKITIVHSLAEDFVLSDGKADVLISEWMGFFLIFENMLPSVLAAKQINLKEDGIIIPNRAVIRIAAFEKPQAVNGIVLKSLEKISTRIASIEILKNESLLTESQSILDIDIQAMTLWKNMFQSPFVLTVTKKGTVKGIAGWFDVDLIEGVTLSTSPQAPPTHWKQTLFYFQQEFTVEIGDKIVGNIMVEPINDDHRGLQFHIEVKREDMRRPFRYLYWLQ